MSRGIAGSLGGFCGRWCGWGRVGCGALKEWKLNIFRVVDRRVSFYSQNTYMLPHKPKIGCRCLGSGIGEFHRKCVLVPADGAAGSVVIVWRLHCIDTLKQELSGTGACGRTSEQGGICHR